MVAVVVVLVFLPEILGLLAGVFVVLGLLVNVAKDCARALYGLEEQHKRMGK